MNFRCYIFCIAFLFLFQNNDSQTILQTNQAATKAPVAKVNTFDVSTLDAAQCNKKRRGCCESLYFGDENTLLKCFTLHQAKLPPKDTQDLIKSIKFLSCFVECLLKQDKFIAKTDDVNMKMVEDEAEIMFPNKPKEKAYYIKMFEFCRIDAQGKYGLLKFNPATQILFKDACRPYFMFVFLCVADYHKKKGCPYFKWEGSRGTAEEETCSEAKSKCYEIDGIVEFS